MIELAESLIEQGGFVPEAILTRYVAWYRRRPRDLGRTIDTTLTFIAAGYPPLEATALAHRLLGGRTAGIGAAHRALPLGLWYRDDPQALAEACFAEARLTHYDPRAGVASLATCQTLALSLNQPKDAIIPEVIATVAPHSTRLAQQLAELASRHPLELRPNGEAFGTLEAALWCFCQGDTAAEALTLAAEQEGPGNWLGCLVGAWAGAYYGEAALPTSARARTPEVVALCDLAERLTAAMQI